MQQIKKMGDLKSLMSMIPGVSKAIKDVDIDDKALVRVEAIIQSMTPEERGNPDLLNLGRKKRISKGCGQTIEQINMFVKNFNDMRKMMHQMANMPMGKMGMPGMGMPKGGFRR
jgi:signal recognition particle subunit SRP54